MIMRIIIILLLIFTFTGIQNVFTQESGEIEDTAKKEPKKADYPWYWNRPYVDIDNFENSSLGKKRSSVTKGYKDDSQSSSDNVEINKKIEEDIQKSREKQQEFEIGYSSSTGLSVDPDGSIVESAAVEQTETVKGTLTNNRVIRWVDKDGVVHVSNDPTEVYKRSK
jgi:hypothetical protein